MKIAYAVFAEGECLDRRYANVEDAEVDAEHVRGDFPGANVEIDVAPEYSAWLDEMEDADESFDGGEFSGSNR